jgi:hypothetical protein
VLDANTTNVILGLFGVLNTGLLVYQAIRLQSVHGLVNGAKDAAVQAATLAAIVAAAARPAGSDPLPRPE